MEAWLIAALVVSWVLVFALAGLLLVLMKQHGELIAYQRDQDHRLEKSAYFEGRRAVHEEMNPPNAVPEGLPIGSPAPDFALPDLEGNERTLESYRGRPFVLAFFSDACGYCQNMAPKIGALEDDGAPLVLLSHGDFEAHRALAAEHGWRSDVLIEPEWDLSLAYKSVGTPSGYLIDADGRIASGLALGDEALLALRHADPLEPGDVAEAAEQNENGRVDQSDVLGDGSDAPAAEAATTTALKTRDVSESKIVRDGLPAGTEAPNFVLADLDGKPQSIVDYRGKRVLLVFSDVTCGPCEAMSPGLVELAEGNRKKLQVLMVSRGDEEENRRKAEVFGFPFPVVVQKGWEISKLYGMFATPIAYLIDENGIIERDVATGPEPILSLV